ncbi:MAG: nickel/cobalt transporter [Actinomycetota bacterium]
MRRPIRRAVAAASVALGVFWPTAPAHAHPLGNFTVNVAGGVIVRPDAIVVDYVVDMAEIPAFRERRTIDANLDDRVDERESLAYRDATCATLADGVTVRVGGVPVPVTSSGVHALSFPAGAGGLSTLRLECRLVGALATSLTTRAPATLAYVDRNFPDAIGWREVTAVGDGVTVSGSALPEVSPTARLTAYPPGELSPDVRTATLSAVAGGARLAGLPEPGSSGPAAPPIAIGSRDGGILASLAGRDEITPVLVGVMLLVAFGVGALHALGPGHGKTLIGAYLVGAGGSMRHAVGVGVAVSVMHTASVLALGLLVLSAERLFAPERVYPVLGLASGVIALGLGSALLVARIHATTTLGSGAVSHGHGHDHPSGHDHAGGQPHDHVDGHDEAVRSDTPGSPISRRGLLALAFSGGILPSPSALVVLLASVSLGRTALGLVSIAAFSAGLAAALIGVGVLTLRARDLAERRLTDRAARLLPVASAGAIAAMGLFLTVRGALQL